MSDALREVERDLYNYLNQTRLDAGKRPTKYELGVCDGIAMALKRVEKLITAAPVSTPAPEKPSPYDLEGVHTAAKNRSTR